MIITWYGTASVKIQNNIGSILFDPFVPLSGLDVPVTLSDFDGATDVFVTHGHIDHIIHIPALVQRNPKVKVYCTETPYRTLCKKGVPKHNLILIRYESEINVSDFRIHIYHGKHAILPRLSKTRLSYILHSSNRRNLPYILREVLRCPEKDETVFYQIECDGKQISLMGSMNLREEITYPVKSDLLILPYNGWENNFPPAVKIIDRLKPEQILLDHYDDTFPPVTMPLDLSPILEKYDGKIAKMEVKKPQYLL